MKVDAYATRVAEDTVRIERTLPGPIELVWAYLTESDKRRQWLASGDMTLRVDSPVELLFRHAELSEAPGNPPPEHAAMAEGHLNTGRITACDPPRLLAYTWGENHGDPSEVRFELAERGDDVLLTIVHTRLDGRDTMRSVAGGWHTHLDILVDRLHGRMPPNFWETYALLNREYEKRLDADSRPI